MRGLTPLEYRLLEDSWGHECGSGEVTEDELAVLRTLKRRGLCTFETCPRCSGRPCDDDPDYEWVVCYSLLTPMGALMLRVCKTLEGVGGDLNSNGGSG